MQEAFDELRFFSEMKAKPGVYIGGKSLCSLRDYLFGMQHAFVYCGKPDALRYFHAFVNRYSARLMKKDANGYACWWNYILYTSGNSDALAFDNFYRAFEDYLKTEHDLCLSEI